MNNKPKHEQMTALEWLIEETKKGIRGSDAWLELLEQAKEMEKEQKHAEYMRGWKDGYVKNETIKSE